MSNKGHLDIHHDPNATEGAVDISECRSAHCYCELCLVCGLRKHSAVHGPHFGEPPGSKPWGHKFVARQQTDRQNARDYVNAQLAVMERYGSKPELSSAEYEGLISDIEEVFLRYAAIRDATQRKGGAQ